MTAHPTECGPLEPAAGILLQGGRLLLLFDGAAPLPRAGRVLTGERSTAWHAASWQRPDEPARWPGLALVDGMPAQGAVLVTAEGERVPLAAPPSVDLVPDELVALVRGASLDGQAIFGFLVRHLVEGRPTTCEIARAHRAFARDFLTATAEPDGFIEIVARPECGGLFLQGWSQSLGPGPARVTSVAEDLALRDVEIAVFERSDVLAPARGCCLFGLGWEEPDLAGLTAVFFEREGRLARLDVVPSPLVERDGARGTKHVRDMLGRLAGDPPTLRAFRLVCRPRFDGTDTLTSADVPVAAAVDLLLEAQDGSLLVAGWLLDPLKRVEMAIVKSTGGLYAPIHAGWTRLPRPDVAAGFAADPRFANLLDPADVLHGFVAHARPKAGNGGETYLELVLDEGALFLPLRPPAALPADRVAGLLPGLAPPEPEFGDIVRRHLAPFLAAAPPRGRAAARAAPPIPLGGGSESRPVSAILPVERLAHLQPVLGLLARSPDAERLRLTLVLGRTLAREAMRRIEDAFAFYDLPGDCVVVPDGLAPGARLDAGLEAASSERVLAWHPSALPQRSGWLAALLDEADGLGRPGLLSPCLIYEDGSIYFAGEPGPSDGRGCGRLGYGRAWLEAGAARPVAAAAAEVALVGRDAVIAAGGFSGRLFSGRYDHVDLSRRLAALGIGSWRSGRVVFWQLEDAGAPEPDHSGRVLTAIDRALLARLDPHGANVPT